jgi:DNA-binding protein HU-beta/integration host factor subunit beta
MAPGADGPGLTHRHFRHDEWGSLMTRRDMAKAIADETGIPQAQAAAIVQRIFDGITETLLSAGRIELRNFGVFEIRERKPRRARNPRTGEAVDVPARLIVTFKPGKEMAKRVRRLTKAPGEKAGWSAATPAESRTSGLRECETALPA